MYAWLIQCLRVLKHNQPWCWCCEICDFIKHMCSQLHILVKYELTTNEICLQTGHTCHVQVLWLQDYRHMHNYMNYISISSIFLLTPPFLHLSPSATYSTSNTVITRSLGVAILMKFSSGSTIATCRRSIDRAAGWRITHAADIGKTNPGGQYQSSIHLILPSWEKNESVRLCKDAAGELVCCKCVCWII